MYQRAILERTSLCKCGFNVLHDHIVAGAVYEIDLSKRRSGILICGGCKTQIAVSLAPVKATKTGTQGWLPIEIFSFPNATVQ